MRHTILQDVRVSKAAYALEVDQVFLSLHLLYFPLHLLVFERESLNHGFGIDTYYSVIARPCNGEFLDACRHDGGA